MIIKYFNKDKDIPRNIACIGNFDGVHLGHQALINKVVSISKEKNLIPTIISFYPDPSIILNKENYEPLNSFEERIKLYERYGIEMLILIDFDEITMKKTYKEFEKEYLDHLNIDSLICGYDFTYGYKGLGNIETLKEYALNKFDLIIIDEIKLDNQKISSSRIKEELKNNNIKKAQELLGYEYKK